MPKLYSVPVNTIQPGDKIMTYDGNGPKHAAKVHSVLNFGDIIQLHIGQKIQRVPATAHVEVEETQGVAMRRKI